MLKCPKCGLPLCRREIGGAAVHSCPDCRDDRAIVDREE